MCAFVSDGLQGANASRAAMGRMKVRHKRQLPARLCMINVCASYNAAPHYTCNVCILCISVYTYTRMTSSLSL